MSRPRAGRIEMVVSGQYRYTHRSASKRAAAQYNLCRMEFVNCGMCFYAWTQAGEVLEA